MNSIKTLIAMTALLLFTACSTQIKNAISKNISISGNCETCETTIEKAGSVKNIAKVDWDKDSKMAMITYDSLKTNQSEILKRIALAGYDSDEFLAPDRAYAKLPGCCQYERVKKTSVATIEPVDDHNMNNHDTITSETTELNLEENQLTAVFDRYFEVKDALVKSDGVLASSKAKSMLAAINAVKMNALSNEEHMVWMKVMKELTSDVKYIGETSDLEIQRSHFGALSDNVYQLLKVSKQEVPTYYQHCPMADDGKGANWLSKESGIKNPFYGSKMLSCGSTVETIK